MAFRFEAYKTRTHDEGGIWAPHPTLGAILLHTTMQTFCFRAGLYGSYSVLYEATNQTHGTSILVFQG